MIFITADKVAELIGVNTADAFLRKRAQLEAEQQFPTPVPTQQRPMIWRQDAIISWIENRGLPNAPQIDLQKAGHNVYLLKAAQSA